MPLCDSSQYFILWGPSRHDLRDNRGHGVINGAARGDARDRVFVCGNHSYRYFAIVDGGAQIRAVYYVCSPAGHHRIRELAGHHHISGPASEFQGRVVADVLDGHRNALIIY